MVETKGLRDRLGWGWEEEKIIAIFDCLHGEAVTWARRRTSRSILRHFWGIQGKMLQRQLERLASSYTERTGTVQGSSMQKGRNRFSVMFGRGGGMAGSSVPVSVCAPGIETCQSCPLLCCPPLAIHHLALLAALSLARIPGSKIRPHKCIWVPVNVFVPDCASQFLSWTIRVP